jgi:pilus assembly protein FimV
MKTATLAFAVLFLPAAAMAAGLGKLTVLSGLGQPLQAEIDVVSLQPNETDSLSAKLAPTDAFRQANIEINGALLQVKFGIATRPGGRTVVTMTSTQPMNEPFVDMLIELDWASGRLTREYTFLLDPPEYNNIANTAPAQPAAPAVVPPAVQQPAPAPAAEAPKPAESAAAPATPAAKSAPAAGTYTVKKGDTLSKIANSNRIDGVSMQQMLVALYRGNQDAFDGQNMNRLRTGQILNLPDKDAATAVSDEDASRLVSAQSNDYAQYRRSLGSAVAQAPSRADTGRQASGKIGAPAEEKPAAPAAPAKDQMKVAKADEAKPGSKVAQAAAKDDAASKAAALKEANDRAAALEKNVADMKKLAEMKSQTGAQLQQQAQAAKADAGKAPAPAAAPAVNGASKAADASKAPATPPSDASKSATDASKAPAADASKAAGAPSADAAKAAAPAATPPAAPKPAPKPVAPPPPPPPEPGLLDQLTDNPAALGGGGLVVVLLAGYAVYAVRKKRKPKAAAASDIDALTSGANSVFGPSGGASIDTNSSLFQSDFAPEAAAPGESEEIDPIAEADVYMAYGRDAQAEEILKEALAKDPSRNPVRMKLLEIYSNRKDATAFNALAGELHRATGGQGAEWEKAAALGAALDPSNLLYGGSGGGTASPASVTDTQVLPGSTQSTVVLPGPVPMEAAPAEEPTISMPALSADELEQHIAAASGAARAAPVESAAHGAEAGAEAASSGLDFDLDLGASEQPAAGGQPDIALGTAAPAADSGAAPTLDFDLNLDEPKPAQHAAEPHAVAAADEAKPDEGFSIDFELPSTPEAGAPAAAGDAESPMLDFDLGSPGGEDKPLAEAPALDLSSINLDLGAGEAPAAAPDARWQEVATKLDLAKAYQEMGDKEGARELLKEVLNEGDDAQQQQARTMIEAVT